MKGMKQRSIQYISMVLDCILVFVSYYIAIDLRYDVLKGTMSLQLNSYGFTMAILVYSVAITIAQFYAKVYMDNLCNKTNVMRIFSVHGIGTLVLIAILFIFRIMDFSRLMLAFFWIISSSLVMLRLWITSRMMKRWLQKPENHIHVIVVGNGHLARQYIEDVALHPEWGLQVDGYVSARQKTELGICLGSYEQLDEILARFPQNELVVALEPHETEHMIKILSVAEKEGTRLSMIPFYNDAIPQNATIQLLGRTRLIDMRSVPLDHVGNAMVKRVMDVVISLICMIVFSPVMLIAVIGVKLSGPGPILFKQKRIGINKKIFTMYKFRSMRITEFEDNGWSTGGDPRRTRFGCFIRRYSIDELPQLFNVFKGEMSLVGPRPEVPFHVGHFKEEISLYLLRQQVKPGMTGWAQVHGLRGDTSIEERVQYDLWYIENWSLWLDLKILCMTAFGGLINHEEEERK